MMKFFIQYVITTAKSKQPQSRSPEKNLLKNDLFRVYLILNLLISGITIYTGISNFETLQSYGLKDLAFYSACIFFVSTVWDFVIWVLRGKGGTVFLAVLSLELIQFLAAFLIYTTYASVS